MSEKEPRFITVLAGRSKTPGQEPWVAALMRAGRRMLMLRVDGRTEILPLKRPVR